MFVSLRHTRMASSFRDVVPRVRSMLILWPSPARPDSLSRPNRTGLPGRFADVPTRPRAACPTCRRLSGCTCATMRRQAVDEARGSATHRGYGAAHHFERGRWMPEVNAGLVACAPCGRPILAGQAWDLGHTDDRRAWTGPEHASCNRAAAARRRNGGHRNTLSGSALDRGHRRSYPRTSFPIFVETKRRA